MTFKPFNLTIACERTQRSIALPLLDKAEHPETSDTERKIIADILDRLRCYPDAEMVRELIEEPQHEELTISYDEEQNAPRELQRGFNGTYHN